MRTRAGRVTALTVAGSDSGGGAGIQADLKTFQSLGLHGTSAITCVTAQNPREVTGIQPCRPGLVRAQIEAVFAELAPAAVKTGMLFNAVIIEAVAEGLSGRGCPVIVDPVMVATSGARLLKPSAIRSLGRRLLPVGSLVTPNLDEAEILLESRIGSLEEVRAAARAIQARFRVAALVKGGHLRGVKEAVDFFHDGRTELMLSAPFVRDVSTHGTGCTYAAAIAGYCARGCSLARAVALAKDYVTQAIAGSYRVGKHSALDHPWKRLSKGRSKGR